MTIIDNIDETMSFTELYMMKKTEKRMNNEITAEGIAEVLTNMADFQSFSDGLTDLIIQCGYDGDDSSYIDKAKYLYERVLNAGIDRASFPSKETIRNWFKGDTIPYTDNDRLKMQLLCLALNLTLEQTNTFFRKVFAGMPFNFRNDEECICYFCIRNGKSYKEFHQLIKQLSEYRSIAEHNSTEEEIASHIIKENLSVFDLENEEELLSYLVRCVPKTEIYYRTAKRNIRHLLCSCGKLARLQSMDDPAAEEKLSSTEKARAKRIQDAEAVRKAIFAPAEDVSENYRPKGINFLMGEIYGFNTDTSHSDEKKHSFRTKLSKALTRNFPKQHEIGKALNEEHKVSSEMLRKCLILLKFYDSYSKAKLRKVDPSEYNTNKFICETNAVLTECGFQELYIQNPYDFIFIYCARYADLNMLADPYRKSDFGLSLYFFKILMEELHD